VRLFPNPLKTGEKLTIELDATGSAQVEICNSQGAIVLKFQLKSQREEINLPPLAAGKYFVRLYVGNQQKVIPLLFN
jgi:DNA gyrase inhibitor GyrI